MRKQITPAQAVMAAWEKHNRLRQNAVRLWSTENEGMSFAQDLLRREGFDKEVAEARSVFYTAVVESHGPKTVVEWKPDGFILWSLEAATSAV